MDTHFTPTDAQQRYLDACLDPHVAPNVEARCLAAGIARQTYYNWTRQAGFVEWLQAERRRIAHAELPGIMAALARKAKAGSVEHARLFLEMAGEIGCERRSPKRPLAGGADLRLNVPRPRC